MGGDWEDQVLGLPRLSVPTVSQTWHVPGWDTAVICDVCGEEIQGEMAEGSAGSVYHASGCARIVQYQRARLARLIGARGAGEQPHGGQSWPFPAGAALGAAALPPPGELGAPGPLGPGARRIESYGEAQLVVSTPAARPRAIALVEQGGGWLTDAAIPDQVRQLFLNLGCVYVEAYYPVGNLERAVLATRHAIQYAKAQAGNWNGAPADRVFVSGASAGGFNAIRAAQLEGVWRVGGYSAACLSLSGAPVPPNPTGEILRRVIGGDPAAWADHTPLAHLTDPGGHRLVGKLFHSTGDSQIPLAWSVAFVKAANAAGHQLTLYVQQGGEHMSVCPGAWRVTDARLGELVRESYLSGRAPDTGDWYELAGGEYREEGGDVTGPGADDELTGGHGAGGGAGADPGDDRAGV